MEDQQPTAVESLASRIGADATDSDFLFGAYVFCMDFHGGQWSEEYQAMCEINASLRDNHIKAIQSGKHDKGGEWEASRMFYRQLKRHHNAKAV